ncbi:hypothetical protein CEXT_173281 [Caerostris extrusa]|uniref:Secreted protein n=1 Tax=Caerostris extrusa TaxID=172846 RepID=A0AAV4VWI2_CAEEX|nr:hypothetical protein CEXT_173281 [Caerostris extrusa]
MLRAISPHPPMLRCLHVIRICFTVAGHTIFKKKKKGKGEDEQEERGKPDARRRSRSNATHSRVTNEVDTPPQHTQFCSLLSHEDGCGMGSVIE